MIRYPVDRQKLLNLIQAKKASWLSDAQARTAAYAQSKDYTGGAEFWGDIKQVYIDLQHEKCAYCETKLQGRILASKVHEVEHFRPKSSIKAWPDRKRKYWKDFPAHILTSGAHPKGYYLLAYHPYNYAIACTRCNSTLKSNYFPVRGSRNVTLADPAKGASEDALLIFPLMDIDDDPSNLIEFDGVLAVPRHAAGALHERAVTTIWFFQLNHEDLTIRRAEMIGLLWNALEQARTATDPEDQRFAQDTVEQACSARAQFSSCMASFRRLYGMNRERAREKAVQARAASR